MRGVSLNTPNAEQNKGEKEMTQSKTKKALLMSVLSMVLCVAMLVGMTFAWFTDTASTGVNKIVAGNLDVVLYYADNATGGEGTTWTKLDNNSPALNFLQKQTNGTVAQSTDILWEPGCTYHLPAIKIVNEGNLALKYKIQITGISGDAELNKVIDWTMNLDDEAFGLNSEHKLAAKTTDTTASNILTISGRMQESAGNEYQGKHIDGINITVYATQDTVEADSYGPDYDKTAQYPDVSYKNATSQESLNQALEESKTSDKPSYIEFSGQGFTINDTNGEQIGNSTTLAGKGTDNTTVTMEKASVKADDVTVKDMTIEGSGSAGTTGTLNINGNNTTIENVDYKGDGNIAITVSTGERNEGTVFKKTKITNAFRGIQFWALSGDSVIDDCILDVAGYTFNIDAAVADSTLTIKDSTLNGWTSYTSGIKLVSFENCKLGLNAYEYLRPYSETKITNCEFTSAEYKLNAGGTGTYTITISKCKKNGTEITAENVKSLLLDTGGWNKNAKLIVDGKEVTV